MSFLLGPETRILVIEPVTSMRQLIADLFKERGFKNFRLVVGVKEAVGLLEVETIDWILTPLLQHEEMNALQLLTLLGQEPQLRSCFMTLALNEEESAFAGFAFERGLLNVFKKPYERANLGAALDELSQRAEREAGNTVRLAASYLLDELRKAQNYKAELTLLGELLRLYPNNPEYPALMVEPLFQSGEKERGKKLLQQIKALDPSKQELWSRLKAEHLPEEELEEDTGPLFEINCCVIVDPDQIQRDTLKDNLKNLRIPNIESFLEDGLSAAEWLEKNEAQLILHEWRIPKLSGPLFIQRVRHRWPTSTLIAISSLLKKEDTPLLEEMGVMSVIEKPIVGASFLKQLIPLALLKN